MLSISIGSLLLVVVSAFIFWFGWACRKGTLRRNHILGYRTPFTLSSDEAWREVHRALAPCVLVGAAGGVVGAVLAFVVGLFGDVKAAPPIMIGGFAWIFLWIIVSFIPAHLSARRFKKSLKPLDSK